MFCYSIPLLAVSLWTGKLGGLSNYYKQLSQSSKYGGKTRRKMETRQDIVIDPTFFVCL